jgi:hypothetical protein
MENKEEIKVSKNKTNFTRHCSWSLGKWNIPESQEDACINIRRRLV